MSNIKFSRLYGIVDHDFLCFILLKIEDIFYEGVRFVFCDYGQVSVTILFYINILYLIITTKKPIILYL